MTVFYQDPPRLRRQGLIFFMTRMLTRDLFAVTNLDTNLILLRLK